MNRFYPILHFVIWLDHNYFWILAYLHHGHLGKKNLYYFNEDQLKLDYKITNQIKCNQDYEKIEKNFIPFLSVSKVD